METQIHLSLRSYDCLLKYAPEESPAGRALQMASEIQIYSATSPPPGIGIPCDLTTAHAILDLAKKHCPEAILDIARGISESIAKSK